MLIKRVTIQGFKTFAERTDFVFDPGVTAIVGPNGSGKSNVVDAIRWCLGEQSFSLLRSKKTGDVIFAGSDKRSRLGMAEVRLTLDNAAGELPIDFTEVEIARRAYRDGANEYLLNGKRVRLADITNLLAQTGLGRRTYALIGQGLIDRVLSLAPEELRSLFEEAAGITGYQSKRVATLRQLEAAQNNLVRIQDILAELTPRVSSLRRQANRAREREEIAQDLQGLLRDWYGYHWHTTQRDLELHRAQADKQQEKVLSLQRQVAKNDSEITAVRAQQADIRSDLGELRHNSSDLHRTAEQYGKRLAVAQERLRHVRARHAEYTQEMAPLQHRYDSLCNRVDELEKAIVADHGQFKQMAQSAARLDQRVEEQRNLLAQRVKELAHAREAVSNRRSDVSAASARIEQFKHRIQELHAEIGEQAEHIAKSTAIVTEHGSELKALLAQQESWQQTIDGDQNALATFEEIALALQANVSDGEARLLKNEREQERLQTRQEMLQRLQDEGAGYASGVRAVLQAANRDLTRLNDAHEPLPAILGTVASLIRVPERLDKAVEIALGAAYQNIVVATWEDARRAIDFLQSSGKGRATFLPLDRLHVPSAIAAPKHDGVVGNAAQLVTCDEQLKPVVQQLLNRTWIVQDLTVARSVLDLIKHGSRPTVVTLSGEVVRPGGAVSGGSDHSRRDDSILARQRELRELPQQRRQIAEQHNAIVDELNTLQQQVHHIHAQSEPVSERLAKVKDQLAALRIDIDLRNNLHAQARQTQEWHQARHRELELELAAVESNYTEAQRLLQEHRTQLHEAEEFLAGLENVSPQHDQDDLLAQLTQARTKVAQAETVVASKRTLLREHQAELATIDEQIETKRRQISNAKDEEHELVATIAELESEEHDIGRQIAELQVQITPLERDLGRLESMQATAEAAQRQLQEELRKEETTWNKAQLQLQRAQDSVEQLRKNIENDLGLVLWESQEELDYQPPLPWATIVEQLPNIDELPHGMDETVRDMRARLSRVSNVNPDAPREYEEAAKRHQHLSQESADLESAISDLRKVLRELDEIMEAELDRTFSAVTEQFVVFFDILFGGGSARLVLADPDDIANSGIEIVARPPGKRAQTLALLSGGERTLTACALIFAILKVSPTPFCVLDEVDAALDEANIDRFRYVIKELCDSTQFILITHNRRTLEGTNAIYGITLGSDSASRVISLRLHDNKLVNNKNVNDDESQTGTSQQALEEIESVVQM